MNQFAYRNFYRRNLPHIQPEGATLFITFRLANSLPPEVIERLKAEKEQVEEIINQITDKSEREKLLYLERRRFFSKWDNALDSLTYGECYLSNPQIAELIVESLHYRNGKVFEMEAFCIMPNHGHLVCTSLKDANGKYYSLSKIMHSLKRYTAREANLILGRTGVFWQHENYDRFVRDETELERIIKCVLNNPVKAGLVDDWTKWKWSYCKYDM
ncbi:MAG: transposase [Chloroflexota bacterium]